MLLHCSKDYLAVYSKILAYEGSRTARAKAILDGVCHCMHVMSVTKFFASAPALLMCHITFGEYISSGSEDLEAQISPYFNGASYHDR